MVDITSEITLEQLTAALREWGEEELTPNDIYSVSSDEEYLWVAFTTPEEPDMVTGNRWVAAFSLATGEIEDLGEEADYQL